MPDRRPVPDPMEHSGGSGTVRRSEPFTAPLEPSNLYGHLAATAVPGVEEWRDGVYRAVVPVGRRSAVVEVGLPDGDAVPVALRLEDERDEAEVVRRVRMAFDLDLDPGAMAAVLSGDPALAPLVAATPGRRAPGTLDPEAMVLRAVIGQQVSTAAARTHTARLVAAFGEPLAEPSGGLTRRFPTAEALVADPARVVEVLRMPASRIRTVLTVAAALADGVVDPAAEPAAVRAALLGLPGVGPWTADTVLMRALHVDAFLPTDLGVVQAAIRLGLPDGPRALAARAEAWRPYRTHAVQYLWATGVHAVNSLPA